jgi:hypothetical protein
MSLVCGMSWHSLPWRNKGDYDLLDVMTARSRRVANVVVAKLPRYR